MLDKLAIEKIEKALGYKLYPMVIRYLTTDEKCHWNGRAYGKTTAYIIKLVLEKDREIKLSELKMGVYNDEIHDINYNHWFRNELIYIRNLLQMEGFDVIKIKKC